MYKKIPLVLRYFNIIEVLSLYFYCFKCVF